MKDKKCEKKGREEIVAFKRQREAKVALEAFRDNRDVLKVLCRMREHISVRSNIDLDKKENRLQGIDMIPRPKIV